MSVLFPAKRLADTRNGFVHLEALASNIYVQPLGYGFDGQSAHSGIRVKPSTPPVLRSLLQLRPGEGFYIGKGTFDLVPAEHENFSVSSSGPSPGSYESQVSGTDQPSALLSSHPGRESSAVPESPQAKPTNLAPHLKNVAEVAMSGEATSQNLPKDESKRSLLGAIRAESSQAIAQRLEENGELESSPRGHVLRDSSNEPDRAHGKPGELESREPAILHTYQDKATDLEPIEDEEENHTAPSPVRPAQDCVGVPSSLADLLDPSDPIPRTLTTEALTDQEQTLSSSRAEDSQDSLMGTIRVTRQPPNDRAQSRKSRAKGRTTSICQETPHSSGPSIEPNSSMRSTRSVIRQDLSQLNFSDDSMRILFSSSTAVSNSRPFMKFLSQNGIEKVQSVSQCTVLCVGKGELKKTSKLIMAVMLGKEVITDDWVTESARCNELQHIEEYLAQGPEREREWGFRIREAVERGRQGLKILQDWTVIFTASAKKEVGKSGFSDLKEITTYAGAKSVLTTLPKKPPEVLPFTLVIGTVADVGSPALGEWKCYTRDIISLSVLRGRLEIDSEEFLIQKPPEQEKGSRKRKR